MKSIIIPILAIFVKHRDRHRNVQKAMGFLEIVNQIEVEHLRYYRKNLSLQLGHCKAK